MVAEAVGKIRGVSSLAAPAQPPFFQETSPALGQHRLMKLEGCLSLQPNGLEGDDRGWMRVR
jgi:hypothetical protein